MSHPHPPASLLCFALGDRHDSGRLSYLPVISDCTDETHGLGQFLLEPPRALCAASLGRLQRVPLSELGAA